MTQKQNLQILCINGASTTALQEYHHFENSSDMASQTFISICNSRLATWILNPHSQESSNIITKSEELNIVTQI